MLLVRGVFLGFLQSRPRATCTTNPASSTVSCVFVFSTSCFFVVDMVYDPQDRGGRKVGVLTFCVPNSSPRKCFRGACPGGSTEFFPMVYRSLGLFFYFFFKIEKKTRWVKKVSFSTSVHRKSLERSGRFDLFPKITFVLVSRSPFFVEKEQEKKCTRLHGLGRNTTSLQ